MITKLAIAITATAALSVCGEQLRDDLQGFACCRRAFKREAEQIHAGQTCLCIRQPGKHRFIADGDAMRVRADLCAPHPERSADKDFIRPRRLRNF